MESNVNQIVSCVVNYAYDASDGDELTIRPGDILRDVERLPGGWWKGELRGRSGMFPDNFVTVLQDTTNNTTNNPRSEGVLQGRCRAVFSYQPANPDELPLNVGDVLDVLGEVEEGWWQGSSSGRIGVFPSNFVVMLEPQHPAPPAEPAPALPPKPVKEQCRVLFPYTAVNEDELTLSEGDVVNIVSKDAPDRGWWKGECNGTVGLFPDNFVQIITMAAEVEEKKPDRPPSKITNSIYPVLNKYSEKTASTKELTNTKLSMHKENTISKEGSTHSTHSTHNTHSTVTYSTVTHSNKSESEKTTHVETLLDTLDGHVKKPPVPLKKSPTPSSGVGGLFSGLRNRMLSSLDKTEKTSTSLSSGSSSSMEGDKTDGLSSSKPATAAAPAASAVPQVVSAVLPATSTVPPVTSASTPPAYSLTNSTSTFDHVERNSILNDPRASRVKAPRRRPPSQVIRDESPVPAALSNGHEASPDRPLSDKMPEIKPKAREWEKHKAPWMEELKLNQAKKGSDKKHTASTDRLADCGVEEKRSSHSMEMSKSTSSISSRISVLESFDSSVERSRNSLDKKDTPPDLPASKPPPLSSPTAAGRTITTMLEELKKTSQPPQAVVRNEMEKSSETKAERVEISRYSIVKETEVDDSQTDRSGSTLERSQVLKLDRSEDTLVAQLNDRISNLEKLLEVQNAKFTAAIHELNAKFRSETERRIALQGEVEKLSHCVTQV